MQAKIWNSNLTRTQVCSQHKETQTCTGTHKHAHTHSGSSININILLFNSSLILYDETELPIEHFESE